MDNLTATRTASVNHSSLWAKTHVSSATGKKLGGKLVGSQFCLIPETSVGVSRTPGQTWSPEMYAAASALLKSLSAKATAMQSFSPLPQEPALQWGSSSHAVALLAPRVSDHLPQGAQLSLGSICWPHLDRAERVQPRLAGSAQRRREWGWRWQRPLGT